MRTFSILFLLSGIFLPRAHSQLDSTFVELFERESRISSGLNFRNDVIRVSTANDEREFSFRNRGLSIPIGFRYRKLFGSYSIPVSDLGVTDNNASSSLGGSLRLYRNTYFINIQAQRIRGFLATRPGEPENFRPDIKVFNLGLYGLHILDFKRFSLRAAFKQKNRQRKSRGSFLIGGILNRNVITADTLALPLDDAPDLTVDRLQQYKIGIVGGYGYTWVFAPRWYLTPVVVVGPELRFVDYDVIGSNRTRERVRVSPRIRGRFAVGYNGDRWYYALTAVYLPSREVSESLTIRLAGTAVRLRVGRRF